MEAIDAQLTGMVESFTNMLKAARVPDEEAEQVGAGAVFSVHTGGAGALRSLAAPRPCCGCMEAWA